MCLDKFDRERVHTRVAQCGQFYLSELKIDRVPQSLSASAMNQVSEVEQLMRQSSDGKRNSEVSLIIQIEDSFVVRASKCEAFISIPEASQ